VVGFLLFSLTVTTVNFFLTDLAGVQHLDYSAVFFHGAMPVTVLVINVIVVHQIRRSSADVGLQRAASDLPVQLRRSYRHAGHNVIYVRYSRRLEVRSE